MMKILLNKYFDANKMNIKNEDIWSSQNEITFFRRCVFQICVLQTWLKPFKAYLWRRWFLKGETNPLQVDFWEFCHSYMLYWNCCVQSLAGLFIFKEIRERIPHNSVVETLLINFHLVTMEWLNLLHR